MNTEPSVKPEPPKPPEKRRKKKRRLGLKITIAVIVFFLLGAGLYVFSVYQAVTDTMNKTQHPLNRTVSQYRGKTVNLAKKEPLTILLLGVDQRANDRGRTDSLILLTVNPADETVKSVSIPRDTYVEIAGKEKKDKINHAYSYGGIDTSVQSVEHFLDVPIDYYVEVNMDGFKDIVDAVGGVTVTNRFAFSYEGEHYAKGQLTLNGERALKYSRMRKLDPKGDFGRQERQRQILEQVIHEGASVKSLTHYGRILDAIGNNVKTNLTFDEMRAIQSNYKTASRHFDQVNINGSGKTVDGVYYYFVPDSERTRLSQSLRDELNIK
ncbi:LytR family transcriptional regulator [Sporolactobacillus sp. THM7-7]|nr:LytR family transcriptional regulator [Sporolactobacillus sp. THM7-7]